MNALVVCKMSVVDEEKQTEEMLEELNRQARQNRQYAEMEIQMRRRAAEMYANKRQSKRKWVAVKHVCFCTLCTAALYGFEGIGLPHFIALPGMLTFGAFATAVAVTDIADGVRSWRIKRKVNRK